MSPVAKTSRVMSVWWALHHNEDANTRMLALECYLDESATDGGTPKAVVGGILLDRERYALFNDEWEQIITRRSLQPSIHMKDFGRHGRFAKMSSRHREPSSLATS